MQQLTIHGEVPMALAAGSDLERYGFHPYAVNFSGVDSNVGKLT
jgi:hypothetical protein